MLKATTAALNFKERKKGIFTKITLQLKPEKRGAFAKHEK